MITHRADVCSLLLFHLAWEGKDGCRNEERYHWEVFAEIAEN